MINYDHSKRKQAARQPAHRAKLNFIVGRSVREGRYKMKNQITEFKEAMKAYVAAKKACDKAEEEMARVESEESERAFDLSYREQFNAYMDVSKKLSDLIGISEKEARAMINVKECEVMALIEKLVA